MNGIKTKISIIIPIYNAEKYLKKCIDSITSQTLREIEIICINDGSTDNSLKILNQYEKDERIMILMQKNLGAGQARNLGIRFAKGEYIAFMDADDWYPQIDILENLYVIAKQKKALICGGSLLRGLNSGKESRIPIDNIKEVFREEKFIYYRDYQYDLFYQRFIYSSKMIRENEIYFPLYKRFQDPPFMLKTMLVAKRFYSVPFSTYCYRNTLKRIHWDKKMILELLKAIRDVLNLSKKERLSELHFLNIKRINELYFFCILGGIKDKDVEIYELLLQINKDVDLDLIKQYVKGGFTFKILLMGISYKRSIVYYQWFFVLLYRKICQTAFFYRNFGIEYTLEKIWRGIS